MIEHGSYKIEIHNKIIVVRFYEAWNRETSAAMCDDFLSEASQLSSEPWACLVDLQQWDLGGPEVLEPIRRVNQWCANNNQELEAVVCTQRIQQYLLKGLQTALPNTKSEFFTTEASAIEWLAENGYDFGLDSLKH